MPAKPLIGVTAGDAAGIGAETIVKAYPKVRDLTDVVVISDAKQIDRAIEVCDSDLSVHLVDEVEATSAAPDQIPVFDTHNIESVTYGEPREEYGDATFSDIEQSIEFVEDGVIDGIAMGAINSESNELSSRPYVEPLDLLADKVDNDLLTALLIQENLRVAHLSMHVSLRDAIELVDKDRLEQVIRMTEDAISDFGIEDPQIAVAGLNPHAGKEPEAADGTEEAEVIPAIESAKDDDLSIVGPESPDTLFARAYNGEFDGVVALYHDQGHIPIKLLGFSHDGIGANMFLGVPFVYTTVSHGTAYDIAGEGIASDSGMEKAIRLAAESVANRRSGE
jgi:4-hydroxythreonine-4-phosphate dehydrogenase